jgi:hypothetical protein
MTHDCRPRFSSNHFLKYADDTNVVGLVQDDNELAYRDEVKHLVDWCKVNNLETWLLETWSILSVAIWVQKV